MGQNRQALRSAAALGGPPQRPQLHHRRNDRRVEHLPYLRRWRRRAGPQARQRWPAGGGLGIRSGLLPLQENLSWRELERTGALSLDRARTEGKAGRLPDRSEWRGSARARQPVLLLSELSRPGRHPQSERQARRGRRLGHQRQARPQRNLSPLSRLGGVAAQDGRRGDRRTRRLHARTRHKHLGHHYVRQISERADRQGLHHRGRALQRRRQDSRLLYREASAPPAHPDRAPGRQGRAVALGGHLRAEGDDRERASWLGWRCFSLVLPAAEDRPDSRHAHLGRTDRHFPADSADGRRVRHRAGVCLLVHRSWRRVDCGEPRRRSGLRDRAAARSGSRWARPAA